MPGCSFLSSPAVLLVLAPAFLLAACSEESLIGDNTTAISGRVIELDGQGIGGAGIGVEYRMTAVTSAPALPAAADPPVSLLSPYPNPATAAIQGNEVRIPVRVSRATPLSVSIYSFETGQLDFETELFAGTVSRDTTFFWDGRGGVGLLPNGLYTVRVTYPDSSSGGSAFNDLDARVLINRSPAIMETFYAYNAVSDPGGEFLVVDLPVGALIEATTAQGASAGTQRVSTLVYLIFRSPDHLPAEREVLIAPGDFVTLTQTLTPIFPDAAGGPVP